MKKILLFILSIFWIILLFMPGGLLWGLYFKGFCYLFSWLNSCNPSLSWESLTSMELFFWILWTISLLLIFIWIFYYDNKKLLKKITKGKKIKSFRLM